MERENVVVTKSVEFALGIIAIVKYWKATGNM